MLNRLGVFAARYHRAVLIASALLFVVVAILGIGAFTRLQSGGFVSASASSSQAEALVASHFGGEQGLVILISACAGFCVVAASRRGRKKGHGDPRVELGHLECDLVLDNSGRIVAQWQREGGIDPGACER